jgi:hypothetical protein
VRRASPLHSLLTALNYLHRPHLSHAPTLSTLIKAHIDGNERNLYLPLPFLAQLLRNPSPCRARKERNLWADRVEADISINWCHGHSSPSHARGIHNFVAVYQSLQPSIAPFDVVSTRSMRSIPCSKSPSHLSRSSLFVLFK